MFARERHRLSHDADASLCTSVRGAGLRCPERFAGKQRCNLMVEEHTDLWQGAEKNLPCLSLDDSPHYRSRGNPARILSDSTELTVIHLTVDVPSYRRRPGMLGTFPSCSASSTTA